MHSGVLGAEDQADLLGARQWQVPDVDACRRDLQAHDFVALAFQLLHDFECRLPMDVRYMLFRRSRRLRDLAVRRDDRSAGEVDPLHPQGIGDPEDAPHVHRHVEVRREEADGELRRRAAMVSMRQLHVFRLHGRVCSCRTSTGSSVSTAARTVSLFTNDFNSNGTAGLTFAVRSLYFVVRESFARFLVGRDDDDHYE